MEIIERGSSDLKKLEITVKNSWRWEWLETIVDDVPLNACIRKINEAGKAKCIWCNAFIKYGGAGKKALMNHVMSKGHKDIIKQRKTNYRLPGAPEKDPSYGLAPIFKKSSVTVSAAAKVQPVTSITERIVNAEAMILSFMAENNLPFTMAPKLIELSQEMSRDTKVLQQLSMSRTTASYKMRLGLAKTIDEELSTLLQNNCFSLNIDEATNDGSLKKVLTYLVSFYHPDLQKITVRHLASVNMLVVNAELVFLETEKIFQERNLPWDNVMSVLLDSCGVMRGKKSGFEKRIRDGPAPHLLDIDGDSLHHVHNASKRLTKHFEGFIEKFVFDAFADMKYCTDLRDYFKQICELLGASATMPARYVPTRWLTVFDAVNDFLSKLDAYTLFYYPFLSSDDSPLYLSECLKVYRKKEVTEAGKAKIRKIQRKIKKKNMTEDGRDRKGHVVTRLFIQRKKTLLFANFFVSVLPMLKSYVLLFQSPTPLIHCLHNKQVQLLKDFLSCFIKPELVQGLSSNKLKKFEITDEKFVKSPFIGSKATAIIESSRKNDDTVTKFKAAVNLAYRECGEYLINKMPVANRLLKHLSAIDPNVQGHEATVAYLKRLPSLAINVLEDTEIDDYEREVHTLQVDKNMPSASSENGEVTLDKWWSKVNDTKRYPTLCKMVFALISCFHCPVVESSFSIMGNVMDETTNRMNVSTLSAIQSVKYSLSAANTSSIKKFRKVDFRHDGVDSKLVTNMQKSAEQYKGEQEKNGREKEAELRKIGMKRKASISKKKSQERAMALAKRARIAHVKRAPQK